MVSRVNDPCPCGSGKKYKKCCGSSGASASTGKHVGFGFSIGQAMQAALRHHQTGEFQQAEVLYREVLKQESENADALHLLGVVEYQTNRHGAALEHISRAIAIKPDVAEFYNSCGEVARVLGDLNKAVSSYREALARKPDFALAQNNLGLALQALGRHDEARVCYEKAVQFAPEFSEAYFNLGSVFQELKRHDEAIASYQKALVLKPEYAVAHFNLGNTLLTLERYDKAVISYQKAIAIHPEYAEAHNNLGNAYRALGLADEAIACFQKALTLDPRNPMRHNNLGNMYQAQVRYQEARACYETALMINPVFAEAHYNLGNTLREQGEYDQAIAAYKKALSLKADFGDAYYNLGITLQEQCKLEEATESYERALAIKHNDGIKIRMATMLPAIMRSREEIDRRRETFAKNLDGLLREDIVLKDPVTEVGATNFYLSYHGENNRELLVKVARLHEKSCPSLLYTAAHCLQPKPPGDKIRVGFISKFMHRHSIGKTTRGIIAELSRDKFETIALFIPPLMEDDISRFIRAQADRHVVLPNSLEAARRKISELELDVLFYQDIGMEPFSYFLAFSRLAPVQCLSFGHPDTTGIRNMDYFVSADHYETPGSETHYSEKLFRMQNVASCAYYYKPVVPNPLKPRSFFGLDESSHLYICPQVLFKFHPDFDEVLAGILRADPKGKLVLIEGKHEHWVVLLRERFRERMPDVLERIEFLPAQKHEDFVNLIAVSDVMLDTIHFCGQNTTHEAMAAGTPVVTWPGSFHRARHTLSFYKQMDVMDCVANSKEDYVNIAVRLGTDPVLRGLVRQRILARRDIIWEEREVIREFERFFITAVEAARQQQA